MPCFHTRLPSLSLIVRSDSLETKRSPGLDVSAVLLVSVMIPPPVGHHFLRLREAPNEQAGSSVGRSASWVGNLGGRVLNNMSEESLSNQVPRQAASVPGVEQTRQRRQGVAIVKD
jgi:hypothetical protein